MTLALHEMQTDATESAVKEEKSKSISRIPSPPPNHGSAVPDFEAMANDCEPVDTWRARYGIEPSKQIKLVKLAHMRYQHPDLQQITKFLRDFGMHVAKQTDDQIWYRGYGPDQYVYYAQKGPKKFLGGAFEVESYEDLEQASKIEGASVIKKLNGPGGGFILSLIDPEGFPVNLVHGVGPAEVGDFPQRIIYNTESEKPRKKQFSRFKPGPAAVHKVFLIHSLATLADLSLLGHFGLCVTNFDRQVEWYTKNFNLVPTDFLHVGEADQRKTVAMFAHIDRGEDLVDHHTFFMTTNKTSHVHHCSFEVHDFDTQALGHQWLAAKGYTSVWGVGRHILGSQIFDYWWDTTGNMIEHYADGDLVNSSTPVGYGPAGDESLAVWGPEVPKWFLE